MILNFKAVSGHEIENCFVDFFDEKVKKIVKNTTFDPIAHNGAEREIGGGGLWLHEQKWHLY